MYESVQCTYKFSPVHSVRRAVDTGVR